jgi:hypothetical protein
MRLSEWRARSPAREAMTAKVLAVVEPVLTTLGADPDPDCWVAWGEEPATRYTILAATPAGLVTCHVRVNLAGEGPRASAKLGRWNRVQLGELGIETQGGHRLLSFQVEGIVLRGVDAEADAIADFAVRLIAEVDGRAAPAAPPARGQAGPGSAASTATRTKAAGAPPVVRPTPTADAAVEATTKTGSAGRRRTASRRAG